MDYQYYSKIFKSYKRNTLGNTMTIMLGTIFGKLFGSILENIFSSWADLKRIKARGQAYFWEGRSTLDHNLILCVLVEQEVFASQCRYSCFVDFKKLSIWFHMTSFGNASNIQVYHYIYNKL